MWLLFRAGIKVKPSYQKGAWWKTRTNIILVYNMVYWWIGDEGARESAAMVLILFSQNIRASPLEELIFEAVLKKNLCDILYDICIVLTHLDGIRLEGRQRPAFLARKHDSCWWFGHLRIQSISCNYILHGIPLSPWEVRPPGLLCGWTGVYHPDVLSHPQRDCLFNSLGKLSKKKPIELRISGPLFGKPPVIDGFPSQRKWKAFPYHGVIMMTSSNGNIFRVTGPLCGEFTGPGEFPAQRPVTRSFDVFFDLRLNKRLSKQPWGWWFETPSWSLWRHCNVLFVHRPWRFVIWCSLEWRWLTACVICPNITSSTEIWRQETACE